MQTEAEINSNTDPFNQITKKRHKCPVSDFFESIVIPLV